MPRLKDNGQEVDWEEKVSLNQIKMDDSVLKINESDSLYKEEKEVDGRINLIQDTNNKELLQMKWLDFLALKMDNFADCQASELLRFAAAHLAGSRQGFAIFSGLGLEFSPWTGKKWMRIHHSAFYAGSPLAVPEQNMQTPPIKRAITMQPLKMMNQVKREVLMNLDQNTQD